MHAYIKFENNKFILTDNNSKFGTLLLLKEPLAFNEEKIAVQIGRTVLTLALKYIQVEQNLPKLPANKIVLNYNNNLTNLNVNGLVKKINNEKGSQIGLTKNTNERNGYNIGLTKRKTANDLLYD